MLQSLVRFFLSFGLVFAASGCANLQASLDRSGLREMAEIMGGPTSADSPQRLRDLVTHHRLARDTMPVQVPVTLGADLPSWSVTLEDGREITPRLLSFPSQIGRADQHNRAFFYLYRAEGLRGGEAVLWAPGMGFSSFARPFVARFPRAALEEGYAVLLWVPPYHMRRTAPGAEAGQGFFVADPASNMELMFRCVRELRTASAWLRGQGIARIGGWGGSMGASLLVLTSQIERFDHLALMIPVLDWRVLALDQPIMASAVATLVRSGHDWALLRRAYGLLSPMAFPLNLPPGRVLILAARYDQLTPEALTVRYARDRGIKALRWYPRSHGTVLLSSGLGPEYQAALRRWKEPRL